MSENEFFNYDDSDPGDENDNDEGAEYEADPSVVAYLDQEGAEFAAQRE